ncbi:monoamine oxidase N [Cordyceps militaris]|uniref:Amine oxidase n=1 Tax=Cordyceps militaris TaxID=73501 RepID=A0A2H4SCV1_CORMI|nr:monoamine oxidase N [Cordyceps militaris]
MASRDGYSWTKADGLRPGVPCIGAIQPPSNIASSSSPSTEFDVIVVGAGYAGLTAARDASVAGLKVLLLEARDRIGGRSWSSNIDGYPYEMGGTWVYWGQATVWREIARYGMQDELESSYDFSRGINKFLLASTGGTQSFTHEEEDALMQSGLAKLFNVDGRDGRDALPMPHSAHLSPSDRRFDHMSVADRLAEMGGQLTPPERLCLEGFVLLCSGATLATTSFYEMLHWWALSGYTYEGCVNHLVRFKFRAGQSSFAVRFLGEALASGNLSYAFSEPVAAVRDGGAQGSVTVTTRSGRTFAAKRVISALPLNVLDTVAFEPPLQEGKAAAARTGHVNQTVKVHAEICERDLRSFTGVSYPHNGLIYGFGDGETPAGNTHVVAFGGQHKHFHPEDDINRTIAEFHGFTPMNVERLVSAVRNYKLCRRGGRLIADREGQVFHNWSRDEFAKGAWFFPAPGLLASHFEDLRARQGNIFFASSDWASGWRSFIDGAIEEGTRAAASVRADLIGRSKI